MIDITQSSFTSFCFSFFQIVGSIHLLADFLSPTGGFGFCEQQSWGTFQSVIVGLQMLAFNFFKSVKVFSLISFFNFLLLDKIKLKQVDMGSNQKYPSVWINSKSCASLLRYRISDRYLAKVYWLVKYPKSSLFAVEIVLSAEENISNNVKGSLSVCPSFCVQAWICPVCVSFLLCSSMVLLPMASLMVWRKVVAFRSSKLLLNCSWSIAPWGHCCVLASLKREQNCRTCFRDSGPVRHGQSSGVASPSQHTCLNRQQCPVLRLRQKMVVCCRCSKQQTGSFRLSGT